MKEAKLCINIKASMVKETYTHQDVEIRNDRHDDSICIKACMYVFKCLIHMHIYTYISQRLSLIILKLNLFS